MSMSEFKINPSTGAGCPVSSPMSDWQFSRTITDPCCCEIVFKGEIVTPFALAALYRSGCDEAWIAERVKAPVAQPEMEHAS